MATSWRDASADAHNLLPREAPGKIGTMAANVAERGYTSEGFSERAELVFDNGINTLIGEFITMEALRRMPVLEAAHAALRTYFADANLVLRAGYGTTVRFPEADPAVHVSDEGLRQVEQVLNDIKAPSHDHSTRVPLSDLTTVGTTGSVERVIALIQALSNAHTEAAESCSQELNQAQALVNQLNDDLANIQRSVVDTGKVIDRLAPIVRMMGDNPGTAVDQPTQDTLGDISTQFGTLHTQTMDAIGDALGEAKQLSNHVAGGQQQLLTSSTPGIGTDENNAEWIAAMNGTLAFGGENAVFVPENLQTFVPDAGADRTNDGEQVQEMSELRTAVSKRQIAALQKFAVTRAQRYKDAKGLSEEGSGNAILEAAQGMARALRAVHALAGSTAAWAQYGAPMTEIVLRTMFLVEYRVQFAIANNETEMQPMPTQWTLSDGTVEIHVFDKDDALKWVDRLPGMDGTLPASSSKPWTRTLTAYGKDWSEFVV